ncbi:DUF4920 domain-containing protein [soil metagenome]
MRSIFALRFAILIIATSGSASLLGCKSDPEPTARVAASASAAAAPVDHFGDAITGSDKASLVDVAKNPASYKGRTIVTSGKVTRVCQERGCWMAIKDSASDATVRMHGHSFFVPSTSAGREARVQGTVMMTKDGHECDEMEAVGAQLEIDATGVDLM